MRSTDIRNIVFLLLLLLATAAAKPVEIRILLRTDPTSAEVHRGLDYLGKSGETILFRLDDETRSVKLRFELEGYKPTEEVILTNDLLYRESYPPERESPIVLIPKSMWGVIWLWLKRHPMFFASLTLLVLLGWTVWSSRNRERRLLKKWSGRLETLLDGSQNLTTQSNQVGIWDELLLLAERLLPGEVFVIVPESSEEYSLRGARAEELSKRAVSTLLEAAEESDGILVTQFAGSRFEAPIKASQSALVALCRDGTSVGALLLLSENAEEFQSVQRDLAALLAAQVSSALVHRAVSDRLAKQEKRAAIGNMAAGLSHELNNPLGALQLTIDAALDAMTYSTETASSLLGTAAGAIARARTLNENFLRFTGEAQTRARTALPLADVIDETLSALEFSLQDIEVKKNLEWRGQVLGDRHELEMIITNLMLNAKDAVDESEKKEIRVSLVDQGQAIVLKIRDTGLGISKEIKDRIFEPFFTTKAIGSGWGLGLSVCREIAESHDGQLEIEVPDSGSGTVASLTLPIL